MASLPFTESLRREWRELKQGRPGHRFVLRYRRRREAEPEPSVWVRLRTVVLAGGLLLVGLVLAFIPGPAVLFYALAGALLASQFYWAAAFLDRSEMLARGAIGWGRERWRRWRG